MDFQKYMHVERFGNVEVDGIEYGKCYVFPKIDGTNASVWMNEYGDICAGSRKRELSLENDNQGFCAHALASDEIERFFYAHPDLRLFGEWLVPHTLKTYRKGAWRRFYVFDVMDAEGNYLPYDEYKPLLDEYMINYIPPLAIIKNPSLEQLLDLCKKNQFLIDEGNGHGEGVVVKNYEFKNKYGRVTWAKIVTSEFKEKHTRTMGAPELVSKTMIEEQIVESHLTDAMIEKVHAKIVNDGGWTSKRIPQLLHTVFHDLIVEETWDVLKKYKNPKIDFKRLSQLTNLKIKEVKPELF